MVDWHTGRQALRAYTEEHTGPLAPFVAGLPESVVARVPGTAVYLTAAEGLPLTLGMQARRVRSIAEHIVILNVVIEHEPQVDGPRRFDVEHLDHGFVHATVRFGYMENPDVPPLLERALAAGAPGCLLADATYYVGRETFVAGKGGRMGPVAESLFAFLARNAKSAIDHFGLPPDRVVELGTRIDL
jgi:KUP system potassium uptake protein